MTAKELRALARAKVAEAGGLLKQAVADDERSLTADEQNKFDALHREADEFKRQADATEDDDGYTHGDARTVPGWVNPNIATGDYLRACEFWRGRLLTGSDSDTLRDRGRSLMERALPGGADELASYNREQERRSTMTHEERVFASSASVAPVTISAFVDFEQPDPNHMGQVAQVVEMGSGSHKVPKESAAIAAANFDEGTAISTSEPTIGATTLTATKGAAIQAISIEAVQDSSPELIGHFVRRTLQSVDELETQQALEGDGTGAEFTGVKIASSVNEVDLANGGAALADLDLYATMVTSIPAAERDPARCRWFFSSQGYEKLLQIQSATELDPMMGQTPTELFGFPISVNDQIATVAGTPDVSTVYFGNWRGVLVGRRGADMLDVVPFGATDAAFNAGQVSIRVIRRYAVASHLVNLLVRGINLYIQA